jgi:hypothetical protein
MLTVPTYDLRFNHETSQLNESYNEAMERLHVSCLQLSSGTLFNRKAMATPLLFRDLSGPVPNQNEPNSLWDSVPIPIGVPGSNSRCEKR